MWHAAAARMLQTATICSTTWFLPAGRASRGSTSCRHSASNMSRASPCESGRWRILTCFTTPFRSFTGAWGALMMPRDGPRAEKSVQYDVGALDPHVRSQIEGSVAAALVTSRFLAPRGGKEVSLCREAGGGLRSDESSCLQANAEQRQAAAHGQLTFPFHVYREVAAIGTSAIYTPRGTRYGIRLGTVVMWQHATTRRATRCRTLCSAFELARTRADGLREKSCRAVRSFRHLFTPVRRDDPLLTPLSPVELRICTPKCR